MDTKLRNRHRAAGILGILTVVLAALVMVGLYPFFREEASQYQKPVYEEAEFLESLMAGNYVLYLEREAEEEGRNISPFQFYFPQLAEWEEKSGERMEQAAEGETAETLSDEDREEMLEAAEGLRNQTYSSFSQWSYKFRPVRDYVDCQILDNSDPASEKILKELVDNDSYVFLVALSYDSSGNMEVTQAKGNDSSYLTKNLQTMGKTMPLSSYMEEKGWGDYSYQEMFQMKRPADATFVYAMTENQLQGYTERFQENWNPYYRSGVVDRVFAALMGAVAMISLLCSFLAPERPDHTPLLRVPFEVVTVVLSLAFSMGYSLTSLVAMTNQGNLHRSLLRADILPGIADIMIGVWNWFWWCVPFAVVFWTVPCVRDVLRIGIKRYLKERTVCGLFLCWCVRGIKRLCRKFYAFVGNISLQDKSGKTIFKIVAVNFIVLAVVCSLWFLGITALIVYSAILYLVLRKYYRDLSEKYRILLKATNQIAEGNLDVSIEENLGVFEPLKKELLKIQKGFKVAVDEEVKSQKMKTDLITNMSHDLKTPLTAIITYVNLLKDENAGPEQRRAYIDVLEQKSMRLKSLIEDLFEISKANSNNVTLNLVNVDIVSLLKEVSLELSDKIGESSIDFRWNLPEEKIILPLDSQKTYRIFDNLLTNIMKYAMPGSRAYVDMKQENGYVIITMKNVSANELTFNPEEITERFVRGDQARNTEGSGLGLAIAKSFVELQNGKLDVDVEADLFRVMIRWPIS